MLLAVQSRRETHLRLVAPRETTIEKAVDVKGVVAHDYNLTTHRLEITFNTTKITLDKIHSLINAAGYDTEKSNATDAQYSRVHGCCKYRSMEQHP